VLLPATPTRLAPPEVFVQGAPPGKEPPRIVDVVWIVNQLEAAGGPRLESSRFGKGDRIRARAKVVYEGVERTVELPEVQAGNSPPWIVDAGMEPAAPTTGAIARAVVHSKDPDGDPVSVRYTWFVDDRKVAEGADSFQLAGVRKGSLVHFQAVPNDGTNDGGWRYSPRYTVVNSPPVVRSRPPETIGPGGLFTHTIVAEDPDGDPLAYTLEKGPPGMVLSDATLKWQIPEDAYGRSVQVVVKISDNDGGVIATTFTMTPRNQ
jgi:hypothetical protein